MKKSIVGSLLAALALIALLITSSVVPAGNEDPPDSTASEDGGSKEDTAADSTSRAPDVVAYYFHTTRRCGSCKRIEAYSREAIETGFEEEIANGRLVFHSINIDKPENKHFIQDYKLYTKSLVICDVQGSEQSQWKNLAKVWQLLRDKEQFFKYVQDEIKAYLEEG